ncbi:hypothetical protein PIB30_040715 [Stylosanthes scabra]|uniref:Pentatricopeptide repeat-containing protein n=1 Tax=Stylosanthes scabra TaxID=79078 RepID=A0ABU6TGR0_9FABA|nr:hypothetical protein [Stylosanthes scabra]
MSILSRLRHLHLHHHHRHHFSTSILSSDSSTPLTSKQKTRAALNLLKIEKNPERILEICAAASLTPDSHLDRVALSQAVKRLSAGGHVDGLRRLIEEDLKLRPDLQNERFLAHAMVLYGQAKMLDHAIRTFDRMEEEQRVPRTVKSLNSLLFACVLAKNYKEVKRIYLEFPKIYSIVPNIDTYNLVIRAFCESGSSSSVYSILDEMDENSVKPNATTMGAILAGFYKEEKFEEVGKVLNMMEERYKMQPSLSTYNVRIVSLCKLKRSAEAKALMDGMISRGRKPNAVTYMHLISGFCREGNVEEGKRLLEEMKKKEYKPEGDCYFTLVHFLTKARDFESALSLAKETMAKGWFPNFTTMKNLVNGLASVSKVEDAKQLIKEIKERFPASDKWDEIEVGLTQE